jgi:ubiquinone/menaquinone biosynthesis C-methylase UbiE
MGIDNQKQIEFWNGDAGKKWVGEQEKMDQMLNPLSDVAIDIAEPRFDERVMDVGCGCGATSVELARRGAKVWGIDVSAPMLSRARKRGEEYPGMVFTEADASNYDFSSEQQLIFSRFGVMFFANPVEAFTNLRSALVPRGRMVFLCWQAANNNEWISRVGQAVKKFLPEPTDVPDPRAPGPFAFAEQAYLEGILSQAGFKNVKFQSLSIDLKLASTVEEALDFQSNIGPLSAVIAQLEGKTRDEALNAAKEVLQESMSTEGIKLGSAVWLVTASN